mgnify:CR=1 FL=1
MIMEVLDKIVDAIEAAGIASGIVYGSEPPEGGICISPGPGAPEDVHLDKGMVYRLPVVCNYKQVNLSHMMYKLDSIHRYLTTKTDYSDMGTEYWQIVDIETTASPSLIGREQDKYWIAGSSFEVRFYVLPTY